MAQNIYCIGCSVAAQGATSVCLANGSTPCKVRRLCNDRTIHHMIGSTLQKCERAHLRIQCDCKLR